MRARLDRRAVPRASRSLVGACVPDDRPGGSADGAARPRSRPFRRPPARRPSPSFVPPTPTPVPSFRTYVVVAGDTLLSIARTFDTTARSIAYWNRGTYPNLDPESEAYSPNLIQVGWSLLVIPGAVVDPQTLPDQTPRPASPSPAPPRPRSSRS